MAFIKHVERIEVGIFRIDTIRGEASAQAIAAIVHERDGLQNVAAVMARARLIHDTGNGASGGNAHVAFTQAAAVKRACAGCRLLRRFSIVHAAPHFPHWPNPGNSRRGGLVATGAWRCAAPQGLGSECSVSRVWMQRFTSVTRMLQRSVMCVSKALTPQEEHGGSPCGDRGRNGIQHAAIGGIANVRRRRRKALRGRKGASARRAASDRAERPGADGSGHRMASTRRQAANGRRRLTELGDRQRTADDERHVTQREAGGRRRTCATTPRSSESSIASKQGRRGRKWRNGALLQGRLFRKMRMAHGKEYVVPDKRRHRFHSEIPPREKQAP